MRRQYRVGGRVQGVGFRWSCQSQARDIGLRGWARNLANGDVEVLAEGDSDQLRRLERWLAQGPPAANVTRVEQILETSSDGATPGHDVAIDEELAAQFEVRRQEATRF